jgi:hypothetical protein
MFYFLEKVFENPYRTNVLDGKKLRGEAVKPWSLLAKTSRSRKLEPLYAAVRDACGGLRAVSRRERDSNSDINSGP